MQTSTILPTKFADILANEWKALTEEMENETRLSVTWYAIRERISAVNEARNILEAFGVRRGVGVMRNEILSSNLTARTLRETYGRMFDAGCEDIYANELERIISMFERAA